MIRKSELIKLLDTIPGDPDITVESVLGDSFNFDCRIRVFFNDDDEDWRLRVEADIDENDPPSFC